MIDILTDDSEYIRFEVAKRLGWKMIEYSRESVMVGHAPGRRIHQALPSYARDIRAAWDILELLAANGIHFTIQTIRTPQGERLFSLDLLQQSKPLSHAEGTHAPRVICEAFLRIKSEQLSCAILPPQKGTARLAMKQSG